MQEIIEKVWDDRSLLNTKEAQEAVRETIDLLDKGKIRVAEPVGNEWVVNDWIKKLLSSISRCNRWKPSNWARLNSMIKWL